MSGEWNGVRWRWVGRDYKEAIENLGGLWRGKKLHLHERNLEPS